MMIDGDGYQRRRDRIKKLECGETGALTHGHLIYSGRFARLQIKKASEMTEVFSFIEKLSKKG
jgi:hypothetical protein